jgi:hypothetical protein
MWSSTPPAPDGTSGAPPAKGLWPALGSLLRGPAFAYSVLALLQLRVVWDMWRYRDLTPGDTSSYFLYADQWCESLRINPLWSPLYTMFYGSLMWLTRDPYSVTVLHRLLIVFACSLGILAVLRRLLPPGLAWLCAAWWAILPTNFDACYEVHLFALLPCLAAWLLLLRGGRWARGAAVAVLAASAVLMRNEMAIAAGLLGAACAVREFRGLRAGEARPGRLALAYGVPLALAAALCALVWCRSSVSVHDARAGMRVKHTLNMSQVYVFSYQQRHPEYTRDCWTDYHELMTETFGEPQLPLSQMMRRNPQAVANHFWWNLQLVPTGLEVLLFNSTSGDLRYAPDYPPVVPHSSWPRPLLVLLACCWVAGGVRLVRDWDYWWHAWIRPRAWGWVGMFAVAAVAVPVIFTQRPRPAYLFAVGVLLMAATGTSVWVLAHRWLASRRLAGWLPLAMLAILGMTSPYVTSPYQPSSSTGRAAAPDVPNMRRPLLALTERMRPYQAGLPRPGMVPMLGDNADAASAYVWKGQQQVLDYGLLEREWPAGEPLAEPLARHNVGMLYLNERMIRHLELARPRDAWAFLNGPLPGGWQCVGGGNDPGDRWRLYVLAAP